MKVVILCGGQGTRLREETEFKPKPLVEVGGRPILWHIMKIYSAFGHKDFILPLGYKGNLIKEYFVHYDWQNHDISINLKNKNTELLGHHNIDAEDTEDWNVHLVDTGLETLTALRLFKVKHLLEGEDTFMLTYGDGVADIDLNELLEFHKKKGKMVTITGFYPQSRFGVIKIDDNNIVKEFKEKPVLNDFVNGGFMVMDKKVFSFLDSSDVMLEETMPKLAKLGEVAVYHHKGFWHSMDTYRDYLHLNELWKKNPVWKKW